MTTSEFIAYLYGMDIKLSYKDDRLRINAPEGLITPELQTELVNHKVEILAFLQAANVTRQEGAPPLRPGSRDINLQLSFSQQRLWFIDQFEPGNVAYNILEVVCLRGKLNTVSLEQSLSEIVRRHEVLRTIFTVVEEQPLQRILPPEALVLSKIDLRHFPENERAVEAQRLIDEAAVQPFDLAKGPLFYATLLQRSEEEHLLLLTMHHIISDDWSIDVFSRELWTIYDAFSEGQPSPLAELTLQYADYAQWQREWFQGEVLEKQLRYWKERLAGAPPILELPTDRPHPMVQSYRGACYAEELPDSLSEGLKALSRESGVTLFMTLLAAFQLLLHRYTGQTDIMVGSPIAGRNRSEIENLIGFFVNTLVFRTDFRANLTFRELLSQVYDVALGAYEHQELPFEKLVENLKPERQRGYSPLIQVMFSLENISTDSFKLSQLTVLPEHRNNKFAQFDLTLVMKDNAKGLNAALEYNTDLFDRSTIERMMGHFQTLLEGVASKPEQPVSELPLLKKSERHRLLVMWNDTRRTYPRSKCIHQMFEDQVTRTPKNVSVVCEGHQYTYFELNTKANQLAHYLQRYGVGPDVLVGMYSEQSVEMFVGVLAVLKAGGAYVPLNASYPHERLSNMIEEARISIMLIQKQFIPRMQHNTKIICLDEVDLAVSRESKDNPMSDVAPHHLAYMIYTSGSTGTPKGVMISHQALINQMHWTLLTFPITEADRMLQNTPLSYDPSIWQFFYPLLAGGASIIAGPGGHLDRDYLIRLISDQKVTQLDTVPSMLRALLEQEAFGKCTSLKRIFCGGEELPAELLKLFLDKMDGELYNMYGPTEVTITSLFRMCSAADARSGSVPIGRPIANTQAYILDNHLQPVPIGVTGELFLGGEGLARGYFNRPELTAQKFVNDPFATEPNARLYRSGDLARYRRDGTIEFLGRIDHQVKVRGYRIELGEIEVTLCNYPGVRSAVVIVQEDRPGDKRLTAYFTVTQEWGSDCEDLRSFLKQKLPDYMIPSAFVLLEEIPLLSNGKVNRSALPTQETDSMRFDGAYVAPRTPIEKTVADIYADVLGIGPIGISDHFFELGGHSLLATQVVFKLRNIFQIDISVRSLFQTPTVEGFSLLIARSLIENTSTDEVLRIFDELDDMSDANAQKLHEAEMKAQGLELR